MSSDTAEGIDDDLFGLILEEPHARLARLSEEHGHIDLTGAPGSLRVGDLVTIIQNHACATTNLHNTVVMHRGGRIVQHVPIAARGGVH